MPPPGRTITPTCPRCAYDQSGEVAAWADRCPVRGTCPECGTEFGWADLFDPSRQSLRWFTEHAPTLPRAVARTRPTVLKAMLPWVFWSRVRVQAWSDPKRLGLWLLVWVCGVHLLSSVPVGLFLMGYSRSDAPTWAGLILPRDRLSPVLLASDAINGLCWPFYTWTPKPSVQAFYFAPDVDPEYSIPYLSPIWTGIGWMLLFLILPTSRRLAKLRFAHLWRAFCVQCAVVLPILTLARVLAAAYEHFWHEWLLAIAGVIPFVLHLWSVLWWAWAIRVGWSIRSWALLVLGFVVVFLSMPFAIGLTMSLIEWVSD